MLSRLKIFLPVTIFIVLFLTSALSAELLQKYKGTLTPPSDEEWQEILQHRTEKHACMAKTQKFFNDYKISQFALNPYPTGNQRKFNVRYYKIDIEISFSPNGIDGYVESVVESAVNGLTMVDYNLTTTYGNLTVDAVFIDGSPVPNYDHTDDMLYIDLGESFNTGEQFTLRVDYHGLPGFDGTDGMEFYYYGGDVAYTNCEPWGARLWWPCKDHPEDKPDSIDIIITHPSAAKAVSNGVLVSEINNGDGTKTSSWHEKYPIATYLVQIGCAYYTKYTDSWEYEPGQYMDIENYSYPGISRYNTYYSLYYMINFVKPSLEALSYYFSMYPFVDEKYGHNHYGWGGAMEHQTLTSISPNFNSEYVIAHELGHQWAGDKVTCVDFHHMWLNEGFATYSEVLYFKYHYGDSYARDWLNTMKHLDAGTPYVEDIINDDMFDNATVYDKGGWVAYMLHMILGDEDFIALTDAYFNHPQLSFGTAHTDDLAAVASSIYGSDMDWFFDAWVYQEGNPQYEYSYIYEENTTEGGYDVNLLIKQVQEYAEFPMPIDIEVTAGAYDTSFTVFNDQRGQVWDFNIPNPPTQIEIDPDEKILRTVAYNPDFTMSILGKSADTAYLNQSFYKEFYAVGGVAPYSWQRISGQYPYGTSFHNDDPAYMDGTPNFASTYIFTLEVTDSDTPPAKDTQAFTIYVLESPIEQSGDCNGDDVIDISDAVFIINLVFVPGSPAPDPYEEGDVDCSSQVDISDAVYLINYVFVPGSPEPCFY